MEEPRRHDDRPVRGIVFDLWNTLAFSDHSPNPIVALAGAFGLDAEPGWRRMVERAIMTRRLSGIGEAIDAIAAATGRDIRRPATRRDLILLWGQANNRNRLYPDTLPALRALRRSRGGREAYRLGILSNTQSFDLDFLRRDGLTLLVDDICLSCDCGLLKPDPRLYRHAASRLGLTPDALLMVGDSPEDDVEGARRAGLRATRIDRTGLSTGSIASLTDLAALIV